MGLKCRKIFESPCRGTCLDVPCLLLRNRAPYFTRQPKRIGVEPRRPREPPRYRTTLLDQASHHASSISPTAMQRSWDRSAALFMAKLRVAERPNHQTEPRTPPESLPPPYLQSSFCPYQPSEGRLIHFSYCPVMVL